MLKFYVYSKKALRTTSAMPDFVALVTSEVGGWSRGWKCTFGPDGVSHPAINAYKTPVPFDEVLSRLGTDEVEGNNGSLPTLDFVPDSYYRQVSIEELYALGHAMEFGPTRNATLRNVFINMSDDTHLRLEAEAKSEGYLTVGAYLLAKALGEPAHISLARVIVFERMKLLAANTVFRSTELMTPVEHANLDARQVGRAISLIVANSLDPIVARTVMRLPAGAQTGQGSYKRLDSDELEEDFPGAADGGIDEVNMESVGENSIDSSPVAGVFDAPVAQAAPEEDPRDRKARLKHNVAYWDSVRAAQGKN